MDTEEGNLYQSFDIAFRDETDFRQFLEDYEGTVFKGNWANQIVYGASVMKTILSRKTNGIELMNRLLNGDSISILNKSR